MVNDNCVVVVAALFSLIVGAVASLSVTLPLLPVVVPCAQDTVQEQRKRMANVASRCNDLPHLFCLPSLDLDKQVVPVSDFFIFGN